VRNSLELSNNEQWYFGFSWYGASIPRWLQTVGMSIKKEHRMSGARTRFVVSREPTLSSVIVAKNKLLPPQGFEFIFVPQTTGKVIVARTVAVQEFEAWGERDYGRPARDAKVGMLPPKLARMMVNMSRAPQGSTILDPFCGSGTVLQEAALVGYKKLVGVDGDERGTKRSQQNFTWLQQRYPQLAQVSPELITTDIKNLADKLGKRQFEAIVTEPWLGPPLTGREAEGTRRQIQSELTDFYRTTIKILFYMLARGGRLVMVWPFLHEREYRLDLPLLEITRQLGLKIVDALPPLVPAGWRTPRGTLIYERPGQQVGREIVVLTK
jgi:tRNA (guanine10-N2)-dimethyltransferase